MYNKKNLLLVCSIIQLEKNFTLMNQLKKLVHARDKYIFSYIDAILIYYYLTFGLQCETCINYIEYYIKNEIK